MLQFEWARRRFYNHPPMIVRATPTIEQLLGDDEAPPTPAPAPSITVMHIPDNYICVYCRMLPPPRCPRMDARACRRRRLFVVRRRCVRRRSLQNDIASTSSTPVVMPARLRPSRRGTPTRAAAEQATMRLHNQLR